MTARLPIFDRSSAPSLPFPRGWYVVADSDELAPGDVRPVKALGRDLVVFRTEDGVAHVTNAYCPHLGAHLGHGGRVVGNNIRCPFHAWEFEGASGRCVKAAHGDPPPPRAAVKRWHVRENDGLVLVWYHEAGEDPEWYVPSQPDFDLPWSGWRKYTREFKARIQDVGENDADASHSPAMHGLTDTLPQLEMETDGPHCVWTMKLKAAREAVGIPKLPFGLWDKLGVPKELDARVQIHRSGFSIGLIRQWSTLPGGISFRSQTYATTTPIDDEHVRFVARHRVQPTPIAPLTRLALKRYADLFDTTLEEDLEVWAHKIYRMRPVASKTDWSVLKFRKWARQFYADGVYEDALRLEDEMRAAGTLP